MSNRKTFKVTVMPNDGSGAYTEFVEAVNPNQARKLLESKLPSGYKTGTFNQVH